MNNFLHFLVLLSLVTLSLAFAGGKCGTDRPSPSGSGASGKSIPGCGDHECDDPAVRNMYLDTDESPIISMRLHVIYCGELSGSALENYDAQMAFFKQEFVKFFKVDWIINVTVTDKYQTVDPEKRSANKLISKEFYIPGWMTLIWTVFNPNPKYILGYAYYPATFDFVNNADEFFCIMDYSTALTARGTTVLHEIGHMFGLNHPFSDYCDVCAENKDSVDRDIIGDFCSDTLPVPMSFSCDSLSENKTDCIDSGFPELTGLPMDNYMAYTPDSCQDQFTPQQSARARCYADKLLGLFVAPPGSFAEPVSGPVSAPTGSPTSTNTPSNAPNKTPTSKVSTGSHAEVVMSVAALALLAL